MYLDSFKTDLEALQKSKTLFDDIEFNARKEALNFIMLISKLAQTSPEDQELRNLNSESNQLRERIFAFNNDLFQPLRAEIQAGLRAEGLRSRLNAYTSYKPNKKEQPHYGYENLDGLLDGVLTPHPLPEPTKSRAYGMVRYEPTPASVILELVDKVQFSDTDIIYDLGSGLGKVIMLVNLLAGPTSVGVEFEPAYHKIASQCTLDLGLKDVRFINADAQAIDLTSGTVFFLFNPFGGKIFDTVFENLYQVACEHPITICSYGSCTAPIAELPWLQITTIDTNHEFKLALFSSQV